MAPEAAPAAPMVQAPEAKAPDAPEAVPMAVPKVLEVSAAHEVAKELPVADPPQLTYEPGDWSSAGGAGETALAGACPRPSHQRCAAARL